MRLSSKIIPLALMAGAFAAPALADEMQMKPGQMMMMGTDGKMTTMQMDNSKMSKEMMGMMDKAAPMKSPMMMMMGTDGKMHMSEDMKMPDGKMMSDPMMMKK